MPLLAAGGCQPLTLVSAIAFALLFFFFFEAAAASLSLSSVFL